MNMIDRPRFTAAQDGKKLVQESPHFTEGEKAFLTSEAPATTEPGFTDDEMAFFESAGTHKAAEQQQIQDESSLAAAKEVLAAATEDEEDTSDAPTDKANVVDLFPPQPYPKQGFGDIADEFFAAGDTQAADTNDDPDGGQSLAPEDKRMAG